MITTAMRASLTRSFGGELIGPGDEGYDPARRVWNAHYDRRPALIAKARDSADVAEAVRWAGDTGVHLSVAAGRHGFSGDAVNDAGLVLDLELLRGIDIDTRTRTVRAGAGLSAGELTTAAYGHGFAIPFGDTGSVGIAGITLGGGVGWLVRRYGATVDQLRSVEVVTADGQVRKASPDVEPDLFWALTGGGGRYGVVTAFEYALNPIGRVTHGSIVLPATPETVEALIPIGLAAPEELTIMPLVGRIPPMPEVAEDVVGAVGVFVQLLYAGPESDAARAIAPFRELGPVLSDSVAEMPYPEVYPPAGDSRWGIASEAMFIDRLDREIADIVIRRIGSAGAAEAMVQLRVFGGAFARSAAGSTAFGHRSRPALMWLLTPYLDLEHGAEYHAWTRSFRDELASKSRGTYLNFLETPDAAAIAAAYDPETLARLASIKRTYDPDDLFGQAANDGPPPSG
jgi:FAD/FMN-containing dehydrogenase